MKTRLVVAIISLAFLALAATPQDNKRALTKVQIIELLNGSVPSTRVAELIHQNGIDFDPDDDYYASVRAAGGEQVVINALKDAAAARPALDNAAKAKQFIKAANTLMDIGDVDGALALYHEAIKANPNDGEAHRMLGMALGENKDWQGDINEQRAAILIDPNDAAAQAELKAARAALAKANTAAQSGTIVVRTSAGAEVYLDAARRGVTDANGALTISDAAPGSHQLKVSAANKKDFLQNVTVATGQTTPVDAPLEDSALAPGTVRTNSRDGLKYAWVPPGNFMMGCSPGGSNCDDVERPSHAVTITKGFWMTQVEVNAGAYKRFAAATQRSMPPFPIFNRQWSQDRLPMVKVSWNDAQAYCQWAGGRLPTEAEWEYAARAGTTQSLYGQLSAIAWFAGNSGSGGNQWGNPNLGGLKQPNAFGLYDMLGNVFEWTNDWFAPDYYSRSPQNDPPGPSSGRERVVRGRAWVANGDDMRVSYRGSDPPDGSYFEGGFRCVCDNLNP